MKSIMERTIDTLHYGTIHQPGSRCLSSRKKTASPPSPGSILELPDELFSPENFPGTVDIIELSSGPSFYRLWLIYIAANGDVILDGRITNASLNKDRLESFLQKRTVATYTATSDKFTNLSPTQRSQQNILVRSCRNWRIEKNTGPKFSMYSFKMRAAINLVMRYSEGRYLPQIVVPTTGKIRQLCYVGGDEWVEWAKEFPTLVATTRMNRQAQVGGKWTVQVRLSRSSGSKGAMAELCRHLDKRIESDLPI